MRGIVLWLGLLCAQGALGQEIDDPEERARALFEEGGRLYETGQYEEAVQAFQIAYSLSPMPLLLYNMVAPLERLGRWDEALEALKTYASTAPEEEQKSLASRIEALEARIRDREEQVELPVSAPVQVESPRKGNPAAIALFGVGVAGVGVGSVFTATTHSARSQWTSECADGPSGLLCPDSSRAAWQRDNTHGAIADIGWVVGLGGLGGGLLVVLGGDKGSDVQMSLGPGHLTVGGRW